MKRSLVMGVALAAALGLTAARADEGSKSPADRGQQIGRAHV